MTENTPGEIAKLTKQLGILAIVDTGKEGDKINYVVQHSANIILIDPNGQWHAMMTPPFDANDIVREFTIIKKHFKGER